LNGSCHVEVFDETSGWAATLFVMIIRVKQAEAGSSENFT
jgi:hypothetical protein